MHSRQRAVYLYSRLAARDLAGAVHADNLSVSRSHRRMTLLKAAGLVIYCLRRTAVGLHRIYMPSVRHR